MKTHTRTDAQLQQDVCDALRWDPSMDDALVTVAVHDGVASLSGTVPTYAQRLSAARNAERVYGVRAVVQHLDVVVPLAHSRSDEQIAEAIAKVFAWNSELPRDRIATEVRDGWITLKGAVEWNYQSEAAERAAQYLLGVKGVMNDLVVQPRATISDVQARIRAALHRSAETNAENIQVEAVDGTITLRGTAHSWSERAEAARAAWAAPGVRNVVDLLTIT